MLLVGIAALSAAGLGASPAAAHESPAGCTSNSLDVTVAKDRTLVRNGDTMNYTVSVANNAGAACDITAATITLTLPAADGTPTGTVVTLGTDQDYPAGTTSVSFPSVPYTVAVDPGVTDVVVEAKAAGTLHDAPVNHAARIAKTLGTDVSQPHMTLTKSASPTSGQAPLPVVYTYTVTNDSSTPVAIAEPVVSDDLCSPVTFVGGDADSDGLLDVGETWTYRCTTTHTLPGTYVNTAVASGRSTVDDRPVTAGPVRATVVVTAPPSTPTSPSAAGGVLPERVVSGRARLSGVSGCTDKTFLARVTGRQIASVAFYVDNKLVKRFNASRSSYAVRINPSRYSRAARHRIVARVAFLGASRTSPRRLPLTFRRCGQGAVQPRFTG